MQKYNLALRMATEGDVKNLFLWRNSPQARIMSLNNDPLDFDLHKIWFTKTLSDTKHLIYIAELDLIPVGSTRLYFKNNFEAEISIVIDEKFQAQGLGSKLLELTIQEVQKKFRSRVKLVATIRNNNLSSIRIFQKCGFIEASSTNHDIFQNYYLILNS